eukprot:TRINITY_DN4524_c0_g2_i1.p1 TRINITY_DN4524_c0_g2~~TRINITY_DN4524_c0_g2_i1.p1  ORF type:complete len:1123 (+),score=198.44 TRINITY_DN4524_c0_g2_i1:406-3774(+)
MTPTSRFSGISSIIFSQLFRPQAGEEKETAGQGQGEADTLLAHHTSLCSTVLDIYCRVARDVNLTQESWEHLLKVLLGVTDSLLNMPKGDDHLSKNLCPLLLRTLFEVWLRSETQGNMWQNLRDLIWHWRHRMPTIQTWNDVCSALTDRVLRILYGKSFGTERVNLFDTTELNLREEHVLYSWYRFLHLLGDLETIPLPENYLEALRGIGSLANMFLAVGEKRQAGTGTVSGGIPEGMSRPMIALSKDGGLAGRASVTFRERTQRRGATTTQPSPRGFEDDDKEKEKEGSSSSSDKLDLGRNDGGIGKLKAPDGNTILHILGPFLFDAINIYMAGYEKGKSKALEVMCSIFLRRSTTDFDDTYLAYFYRGIAQAVSNAHPLYISTLLLSTPDFFKIRFKGANILIPTFITAIKQVLAVSTPFEDHAHQQHGSNFPQKAVLRKSAIKHLGNIICYASHYVRVPFQKKLDKKNDLKSYAELNFQLSDLLLSGIQHENDPHNLQALLWTTSIFAHETVSEQKQFFAEFLRVVLRKVLLTSNNSDQVSSTVLQVLTDAAGLFEYIFSETSASVPHPASPRQGMSEKSHEVTLVTASRNASMDATVVTSLCKFFELLTNTGCAPAAPSDELIILCLKCIESWVMKGKWIFENPGCLKLVLGVLDKCRVEVKGFHSPSDKIKEAASAFLLLMLNQHGQFPPPIGPSNISALPSETELLTYKKDPSKYVACYMFDKTLLTLIRHPRTEGDTSVTLVVRDLTGRYIWNGVMNYFPSEVVIPAAITSPEPTQDRLAAQPAPAEIDYAPSLVKFLEDPSLKQHNQLLQLCKKRIQDEAGYLRKTNFGHCNNQAKPPERPAIDEDLDSTPFRLFLSHTGMLALGNRPMFHLLQADSSKNFNYVSAFNNIDQARERETLKVGVLYVPAGQSSYSDILENEAASPAFYHFLAKLGWAVDLHTHNGYMGGLEPGINGDVVPYYADVSTELVFHVPALMPTSKEKGQPHKAKALILDKVIISWVENYEEYDFTKLEIKNAQVNIIICPMPDTDLYTIRIINNSRKAKDLGPLLDGVVVSKYVLPTQVRQTAIHAARFCAEEGRAVMARRYLIEDFARRYKSEIPTSKFYSSFFPAKK